MHKTIELKGIRMHGDTFKNDCEMKWMLNWQFPVMEYADVVLHYVYKQQDIFLAVPPTEIIVLVSYSGCRH